MQRSTGQSAGQLARQWVTVVAVLMAIAINAISNIYPPAGKNTGEVSNTTLGGVLITPAGYAFAIWGLIYIALIVYSIYQALPVNRDNPTLAKVSWALVGACALQIMWIYVFLTFHFWASVLFMLGILACLWFAHAQTRQLRPTRQIRWLVQAPMSVYFGWITVAAVVNVAGALYAMPIPAESLADFSAVIAATSTDVLWTVVMMLVSAGIAAAVAIKYGDATYPAVAVWALCAIALKHTGSMPLLTGVGIALAVALSILIVRIVATGQGRSRA